MIRYAHRKPYEVEAMQLIAGNDDKVREFIGAHSVKLSIVPGYVVFEFSSGVRVSIPCGAWFVKDPAHDMQWLSNHDFQARYELR